MRPIYGFLLSILLTTTTGLWGQDSEAFDLMKFSDPEKYGWKTFEDRIEAKNDLLERQKLLQVYQMEKLSIAGSISKSILAPGWGHFSAESYTTGEILLGLHVVLLGTTYYFYDQSMDHYDKYKNATYVEDIQYHYDEALKPYRYAQLMGGLWVILWGYTIWDAVVVTEKYNTKLWDEIVSEYRSSRLKVNPTGFEWRF